MQVRADTRLLTYRPEAVTPVQPTRKEKAHVGLGAALVSEGETDSQGFRTHSKAGEENPTPSPPLVTVFYILFVQPCIFDVCFYCSLQAFPPSAPHNQRRFPVSTACPLSDVWCQIVNAPGSLGTFLFLVVDPIKCP